MSRSMVGCNIDKNTAEGHTKAQNTKSIDTLHIGSLSVGVGEFLDGIYEWFYHLV